MPAAVRAAPSSRVTEHRRRKPGESFARSGTLRRLVAGHCQPTVGVGDVQARHVPDELAHEGAVRVLRVRSGGLHHGVCP